MFATAVHEVVRVTNHLLGAEVFARSRSTRDLDPVQRLTRALLLDELARYRDEGRFPKNHDSSSPRPTFIDEHGTRCAMAHLMEIGGASALVAEVAHENNHAYVEELASDLRVVAWLCAAGITVEEAARIQPAYCRTAAQCACASTYFGLWEGTIVESADALRDVYARVDVVHLPNRRLDASALQPGESVGIGGASKLAVGTRVLVRQGLVIGTIEATEFGDVLSGTCAGDLMSHSAELPPISYPRALESILADRSRCLTSLATEDVRWTNGCDPNAPVDAGIDASVVGDARAMTAGDASGGGGCTISTSSSENVTVLLAVVSALAVRGARSLSRK